MIRPWLGEEEYEDALVEELENELDEIFELYNEPVPDEFFFEGMYGEY